MHVRHGVVGAMVLCLALVGPMQAAAQSQGVPAQIARLQAQLDQALATIKQLQADLNSEAAARQAADAALEASIGGGGGGGVSQATLDAAIAGEAAARAAADATLQGNLDGEAAARAAADTTLQGSIDSEAGARAAFDATLAGVSALAPYVSVQVGTLNDLAGPHVIFSGANVHIRSGHASGNSYTQNGLGNLVVGYNEPSDNSFPVERGGSHNVVVGPNHRYNFGVGLIVGGASRLGDDGASVAGGFMNIASGMFGAIGGGLRNEASGPFASVSGGADNIASANAATVAAGQMNQATADLAAVSGGFNNNASGAFATVGGGMDTINSTAFTFVP